MTKPKLAIDIDETLVWLLPEFLEFYNERHKTDYAIEDFESYRWWETLDITKEQAYQEANEYNQEEAEYYATNPDAVRYLEFIQGAEQAVELLSYFYELYCITNRDPILDSYNFQISSVLYADDDYTFFPELRFDGNDGLLIPANRFYSAKEGNKTKSRLCKELSIDTIIDDDPDVAIECASNGIRTIVLARPWNKSLEQHGLIYKVEEWQKACDLLVPGNIKLLY